MRPEETRAPDRRSSAAAGDVVGLIRQYVLQETVAPLRRILKRLAFGAAGGLALGVGLTLLLLALLRVLQTETGSAMSGDLSWAPYLETAFVGGLVLGIAALVLLRAIQRGGRRRH